MCGIAGFVGNGSAADLRAMGASLKHRGPDASGEWLSPQGTVGLAHRRLSVIDLSRGADQPMVDTSGRYHIVFNGEIYNFQDLREDLRRRYPFKTHSDTEVILAAYAAWGAKAFTRMDGMYAFALYDSESEELILARDPLGKKPLYWSYQNGLFLFGSELKALRAHPSFRRELDPRSLMHYLGREYVPTPWSIYIDTQKVPPGHVLRFKKETASLEQFWRPCEEQAFSGNEEEALERLDLLMHEATSRRLIADVPLGIFLSGGIDSSAVAWYAAQHAPGRIQTFSIGFSERTFDESPQARMVATQLGTVHHELVVSPEDALALIPELPQVFDEPVADASVLPTLLLSRFTRKSVTVALGGDGPDELIFGYPTFRAEEFAQLWSRIPETLRRGAGILASALPTSHTYFSFDFKARKFIDDFAKDPFARHMQWLGSFREEECKNILTQSFRSYAEGITTALATYRRQECPALEGLNALSHFYVRTYLMDQVLVKVDRASMHYGLEVRAPFLNKDVVSFLLSLPAEMKYHRGRGKYLLRKLTQNRLPKETLHRRKQGFAPPMARWLIGPLRALMTDMLSEERLTRQGIFEPHSVTRLMDEHMRGVRDHHKKLWTLMIFELWYDAWMK